MTDKKIEHKSIEELRKEFEEKFVKAPDFHDPNTHANYPAEYVEKLCDAGYLLRLSDIWEFFEPYLNSHREEDDFDYEAYEKDKEKVAVAEKKSTEHKSIEGSFITMTSNYYAEHPEETWVMDYTTRVLDFFLPHLNSRNLLERFVSFMVDTGVSAGEIPEENKEGALKALLMGVDEFIESELDEK